MAMLAEIFMLRIESELRNSAAVPSTTTSDTRFVPVTPTTPPRERKPQAAGVAATLD